MGVSYAAIGESLLIEGMPRADGTREWAWGPAVGVLDVPDRRRIALRPSRASLRRRMDGAGAHGAFERNRRAGANMVPFLLAHLHQLWVCAASVNDSRRLAKR